MKEIPALLIRNIKILELTQPRLSSFLKRYVESNPYLKEPIIKETPSGRWISNLTEKPFFEKKSVLQKRAISETSPVYIVFGIGCAPYLFHILRALPRDALSVTVIEPSIDLLLLTLSQTSVFEALPRGCRLSFILNDDRALIDESIRSSLSPIGIFPVSKAVSIFHDGESESTDFQGIERIFKEEVTYLLTLLGNSPEDTLLGIRHGVLNLPRILKSPRITELTEKFRDMPFICVASGPSLEKNGDLLVGMDNKCVIVACDTVLFNLLERGVVPHIVTTIERPYGTYGAWVPRVLEKYPDECKNIILISQSVSYPLISGRWPGPNIIIGKMDVPTDKWLVGEILEEQLMASGLSVAHMSLAISIICQASVIALVGQDFAYAEDGHSHALNTVHDVALRFEQQQKAAGFEIKGVIGGTVFTNKLWNTFLQIMERMILLTRPLIYDCTEGGAYIKGTVAEKLEVFLKDNVISRPSFRLDLNGLNDVRIPDYSKIKSQFEEAFSQLDTAETLLKKLRHGIEKTSAPAITTAKRRESAVAVSILLDEIRKSNPAVGFIGQSYTHLSGSSLVESRFLENVEHIQKWKETLVEIYESHYVNLRFVKQWFSYAYAVVELMESGELDDWKVEASNGEAVFLHLYDLALTEHSEEIKLTGKEQISLSDILSCKDPLREEWSAEGLWKAALFLFAQGRSEEARRFMKKAYMQLEGQEIESEVIGQFLKDWGRMASSHDLCAVPAVGEALLLYNNASRYFNDDDELDRLKLKVIFESKKLFNDLVEIRNDNPQKTSLLLKIADAEKALVEKDLTQALLLAEEVAWESADSFPETSVAYFNWLIKTASSCIEAFDPRISNISEEILNRIILRLPELQGKRINYPLNFIHFLDRKGIKFDWEIADTLLEERKV